MNNKEFEQHFINALQQLGVTNYNDKTIIVEPVFEKDKWTSDSFDDFMRLKVIPKIRKFDFNTALKIFTLKEGFYPCWIEIFIIDDTIHLRTSLRMRKAYNKNDKLFYPFKIL